MFDSNGEPMFDDSEFFDTSVEKFPIGMKIKSIFYNLPYQEHLKITHLLDPMNIFKNVSSSLWRHKSSKQSETLVVRKYLITSKNKNKIGQDDQKVQDQRQALVPLIGISKKVMSHGF